MKTLVAGAALATFLIAGCSNSSEDLEKQLAAVTSARDSLEKRLAERDMYFEGIIKAVNEVYSDLEDARKKEAKIVQRTEGADGQAAIATVQARENLIGQISAVGTSLKDSRKRIAGIQAQLRSSNKQMAGLNEMVESLKTSLDQREQSMAMLQARLQGLEETVAHQSLAIAEKEQTIESQRQRMNTGYFVAGTRRELKEKGIIADEGGFLWGLLGSTTVLASGVDRSYFTPIDFSRRNTISVEGSVDEIIPRRNSDFFSLARAGDNGSSITITDPDKFWQDRYLVVVLD